MPHSDDDDEKQFQTQLEPERNDIGGGSGFGGGKKATIGTEDHGEGFKNLYELIGNALEQANTIEDKCNSVLAFLSEQKGVQASALVGHDGSVLATKIPAGTTEEMMALGALGTFMYTEMVIKKMCHDRIYSIVSQTTDGYSIVVDVGPAILFLLTTEEFDCISDVMLKV